LTKSILFYSLKIIALCCKAWEGDGVVASARKLIGATNPLQAEPGTIRGDLAVQTGRSAPKIFLCLNGVICTLHITF
jgi:nucleoside diphosphate kinase